VRCRGFSTGARARLRIAATAGRSRRRIVVSWRNGETGAVAVVNGADRPPTFFLSVRQRATPKFTTV